MISRYIKARRSMFSALVSLCIMSERWGTRPLWTTLRKLWACFVTDYSCLLSEPSQSLSRMTSRACRERPLQQMSHENLHICVASLTRLSKDKTCTVVKSTVLELSNSSAPSPDSRRRFSHSKFVCSPDRMKDSSITFDFFGVMLRM